MKSVMNLIILYGSYSIHFFHYHLSTGTVMTLRLNYLSLRVTVLFILYQVGLYRIMKFISFNNNEKYNKTTCFHYYFLDNLETRTQQMTTVKLTYNYREVSDIEFPDMEIYSLHAHMYYSHCKPTYVNFPHSEVSGEVYRKNHNVILVKL